VSKYLLRAYEKINKEKIDINNDGINVNNEKNIMYLRFVKEPLEFIFLFKELFISKKINQKK
jgi:hypothetical protein